MTPKTKAKKESNLLSWMEDHKLVPILSIEKAANIPPGTLNRAIRDKCIPERHIGAVEAVLKAYGYK